MAEQSHCAACGFLLRTRWQLPLVTVGPYRYHAICWVMREAPSVKAGAWVN